MNAELFPVAPTYEDLRDAGQIIGAAQFSPCGKYRHWLSRTWDAGKPYANFLLLNPSTATAEIIDPTMERCNRYAFGWGYGGQFTTNIHDFRATDPADMKASGASCSPENDRWIVEIAKGAGLVICGWGTHGAWKDRGNQVLALLKANGIRAHCLKETSDGHPNHPLYLRKDLMPHPYPAR